MLLLLRTSSFSFNLSIIVCKQLTQGTRPHPGSVDFILFSDQLSRQSGWSVTYTAATHTSRFRYRFADRTTAGSTHHTSIQLTRPRLTATARPITKDERKLAMMLVRAAATRFCVTVAYKLLGTAASIRPVPFQAFVRTNEYVTCGSDEM